MENRIGIEVPTNPAPFAMDGNTAMDLALERATDKYMDAYVRLQSDEGEPLRRWLLAHGVSPYHVRVAWLGCVDVEGAEDFLGWRPFVRGGQVLVVVPGNDPADTWPRCVLCAPGEGGVVDVLRPDEHALDLWNGHLLECGVSVLAIASDPIAALAYQGATGQFAVGLCGEGSAQAATRRLWATPKEQRPKRVLVCLEGEDADVITRALGAMGVPHLLMAPLQKRGAADGSLEEGMAAGGAGAGAGSSTTSYHGMQTEVWGCPHE